MGPRSSRRAGAYELAGLQHLEVLDEVLSRDALTLEDMHLGACAAAVVRDGEHQDVVVQLHWVTGSEGRWLLDEGCWESLHHRL